MTNITTKLESQPAAETAIHLFDNWFDPIETGLRDRVREFIHAMIEGELDLALSRPRYARHTKVPSGDAEGAVRANGHLAATIPFRVLVIAKLFKPSRKTSTWRSGWSATQR
jgi:hypothetical protein